MAYIRVADRPKELPERLQLIRDKLNNPDYMDAAIFDIADKVSGILTGRDKDNGKAKFRISRTD